MAESTDPGCIKINFVVTDGDSGLDFKYDGFYSMSFSPSTPEGGFNGWGVDEPYETVYYTIGLGDKSCNWEGTYTDHFYAWSSNTFERRHSNMYT